MKQPAVLDTLHEFETPEGVNLELLLAGPLVRASAWGIDLLLRSGGYLAVAWVTADMGEIGAGLWYLLVFVVEWLYPVFFEVYREGRTPGKQVLGIKVIHDNGTPVGWSSSLVRNILRVVDFLPTLFGAAVVTMVADQRFRRIGDIAAGTLVVYQPGDRPVRDIGQAVALAPPAGLLPAEQQAIVEFVERAPELSEQRRVELAEILAPLTGGDGRSAWVMLQRYAAWLKGR